MLTNFGGKMGIKYYCETCGFLAYEGEHNENCPIGFCPICNKVLRKITLFQSIKMHSMNLNEKLDFIQNNILHKTFEPTLVQKRLDYYHEISSKIREKWKQEDGAAALATYKESITISDAISKGVPTKEAYKAVGEGKTNFPKCPTCGSYNVEHISTGKKVIGAAAFGVLSSDVRNTMHCKNCGYKW